MTEKEIRQMAADARAANPEHMHKHGYVILGSGPHVSGWTVDLSGPQVWVPGCVAVPESGPLYVSAGGSARLGAEEWRPLTGPASLAGPKTVKIEAELTEAQARQFAQFLKRVTFSDFERRSEPDNPDQPDLMMQASEVLRQAFAQAGYAPR